MKQVTAAAVIAVLFLSLSPVCAQNGVHGGKGKPHQMKMAEELGLSQEQKNKLQVLRAKHRAEVVPLQQQIGASHGRINDLLKMDSPDRGAVSKETAKIADLHRQLQELRVSHLLEVKKVMTKEQFTKFLESDKRGGPGRHGEGPGGKE